ncbi:hypothetical protein FXO38_25975 [Capsicum annuum]|uniref:Uncharacterized protein n=1 Tax=Capsicum annuum TaxID=4072 RepID=A0A1U8HFS8_CAPAN|nr:probable serine/threonine-protein kinase PBL25 [Capsicum annuum]KAF3632792.1 hypothetical protein FXO38_25975 [Capsicum annuum]PHT62817.1 hypothetical protein T459_33323 [Capsicum annuum]
MVDPTLQGQYTKKDLIQVAAIAAMCVQTEADYRPLMTDVAQSLVPLVKSYSSALPANSFRCNQTVREPPVLGGSQHSISTILFDHVSSNVHLYHLFKATRLMYPNSSTLDSRNASLSCER